MLLLSACSKKEIPADESILGLDYYPLNKGRFVVYEVDSIIYTELPKDTITYKYQIKEKIGETFTANDGKTAYRYERYIKKFDPNKSYDQQTWQVKEVWMLNADDKKIEMQESNRRFTKLIFPVEEKKAWDGNAGNGLGEQTYYYDYIDIAESMKQLSFKNSLKVIQLDQTTLISDDRCHEKYAKDVGLIYREIIHVLSNNVIPGKAVVDRIESGLIYKQTIVSYGFE